MLLVMMITLPGIFQLRRRKDPEAHRLYRRTVWLLGGVILLSMGMQEAIMFRAGLLTWATALPLHLCSLMGLTVLPALLTRRDLLLHALLFAGLPGALLALIFPAIAETPWPRITAFFFRTMHTGIVLAPLLAISSGWEPRPRGALQAGVFLLGAGLTAMTVNGLTGGNYLFLAAPIAGTPLMWLSRWGTGVYRLLLALLAMLALSAGAGLLFLFSSARRKR